MSTIRNLLHVLAPAIEALGEHGQAVQIEFIENTNEQLRMAGFTLGFELSPNDIVVVCETKS